jgi:hypothetical protein
MDSLHRYPRNLAGLALLLLRASVGLLLLANVHGETLLTNPDIVAIVAATLCFGLCLGIFTPLLSSLAFLGGIGYIIWLPAGPLLIGLVTLLLCVSTAILGAGAYSIDGILFGPRRVIL